MPRGQRLVTRRPLKLQLHHNGKDNREWAEFQHKDNFETKYYDFKAVRQEIEDEMDRHPGKDAFTNDPIILKIHSPNSKMSRDHFLLIKTVYPFPHF